MLVCKKFPQKIRSLRIATEKVLKQNIIYTLPYDDLF